MTKSDPLSPRPTQPAASKRPLKKWARRSAMALGVFIVLLLVIIGVAGTGPVLRAVTPMLNETVAAATDSQFELGRVEGSIWTGLQIDSLLMARDVDGFHLELNNGVFDWSPLALLTGRLQIDRVSMARTSVILPDGSAPSEPEDETDEESSGFSLPLEIGLDELALDEIAIVDPVSGKSFLYELQASAAAGRNLSAKAKLDLTPLDGGTDRLAVDLDFDGPDQKLRADIDGKIDREGLVMTLAGLDPESAADITILLKGAGPADDWKGNIDLSASGYATLRGDVGVQLSSDAVGFGFDGGLEPLELISDQLPEQVRKVIELGISGAFDLESDHLSFDRLAVEMPGALDVSGTADIDIAESQVAAKISANVDPVLSSLIDDQVRWGMLNVDLAAKGGFDLPDVQLSINGRDIETPVSTIAGLSARADLAPVSGGVIGDDDLAASVTVTTKGHVWQDDSLGAIVGDNQSLSVESVISSDFANINLRQLLLETPAMTVRGQAMLDDAMVVSDAGLTADVADLSIFGPISGLDLSGQGQVSLSDIKWSMENGGGFDVAVNGTQTGFGISDLDRIVGPSPTLAGSVAISPEFDMAIDLNQVQTATVTGAAKVDLTETFGQMAIDANLDIAPGTVPPGIGVAIAPAKLTIALDGPTSAPAGVINLSTAKVDAAGQVLENVKLISKMGWSAQSVLSLTNTVKFNRANAKYDLAANVVLPSDALRVEYISLRGEHIDLRGDITLPEYAVPMQGKFALSKLDAVMLSDFGVPFTNGAMTADIALVPDGTQQTVNVTATTKGLRLEAAPGEDPVRVDNINLAADVTNAFEAPVISATLEGKDIFASDVAINDVTVGADGGLDALDVSLKTRGTWQANVPFSVDALTKLGLGDDLRVDASKFDVFIADQKVALREPLSFVQKSDGTQQLDADITVGSGQLRAVLDHKAKQMISADVTLEGVDLGPWGAIAGFDGLDGTANLSAMLREKPGETPTASVKGQIDGITAKAAKGLKPLKMDLDVSLKDAELSGAASLGNDDEQILKANGKVPLAISILEQEFSPDMSAPVVGSVRLDGEIAEFWPYVPAPDHDLSGNIKLALDVSGRLDDIAWKGDIKLADGAYENLEYGTIIDGLTFTGDFDQTGLSIPSITATDGGSGTLDGSVDLALNQGSMVKYDVGLKLRNMALSRKDELQFWADVDTSVTGTEGGADIKSRVMLQRGEVDLTLALPETVPSLDVANLPGAEEKAKAKKEQEEKGGFVGNLDVLVDIPGRLFVRGKGLDSEWGGKLEVSGTTDDPRIVGKLSALRGQLDIIGKTFVIKDSNITFAGASPPDPMLDIKGVYTTSDLEVTAGFQGPASDPELVLTSNPSLPEDEILSQVLFGKSQGSLSAIEAVQLASAVNELSGGGSGLDVVGSVRRFIGADVLQVGGGEDGPEVKVGKYLTDGVYVGTKAGSTPGSSGVEVEIEITPNISVTSETTEIDSTAGIQYRLDY